MIKQWVKIKLHTYRFNRQQRQAAQILSNWKEQGKPVPAPHVRKQQIIQEYQQQYNMDTLVETGTYLGDMVAAQLPHFSRIISIELSPDLHQRTRLRFMGNKKVTLLQGDSSRVLAKVVPSLTKPALFWLDGHYSMGITARGDKECPIYEELEAIFSNNNPGHVMLIDDARLFVGEHDYPTMQALESFINSKDASYNITVKDDVIRVVRG